MSSDMRANELTVSFDMAHDGKITGIKTTNNPALLDDSFLEKHSPAGKRYPHELRDWAFEVMDSFKDVTTVQIIRAGYHSLTFHDFDPRTGPAFMAPKAEAFA